MITSDIGDISKFVRDFADGFSRQTKFSNQVWLALIAADTVVVFPRGQGNSIDLPFALGSVDKPTFALVGFMILVILNIAFCQAYAEAHNVTRLAQDALTKLPPDKSSVARKLFDALTIASFARVAPLVQLLLRYINNTSKKGRIAATYYVILKITTTAVMLGIPTLASWVAFLKLIESTPALWILAIFSCGLLLSGIAFLQIAWAEMMHVKLVTQLFWNDDLAA
jgi:hypothetical protein